MIIRIAILEFEVNYCLYVLLQYFMREEQNFISANEIDNMVLIMPTATRRSAVVSEGGPVAGGSKVIISPTYLKLHLT